ncbi:TRAP transporter small permease [Halococcus salifodinae]|uniref:C4-dicarboxylate transport system permease small protein n=1 Tax=Halococcus salifodinae DSM 8989 TaxID=1227456 RepID=M0N9X9_9EURY|nr:TRAP transporter small permease subunit [Halococcus salifodinae]EMA54767.1 C4-dicarboxylate transport system permease small protein [Halococcus salifodinae DSM 8989]
MLEIVGVALVAVIGVTVTLRVASRPLDFLPDLLWTGEIARYSLVLLTIVGIPYAMRTNDHISIRPLLKSFSGNYQTVLFMVTNVLITVFCLFIAYSSFVVSRRTLGNPLPTVRWLNYGYVNLVMVVMFLLTAVYTTNDTRGLWREYRTPNHEETETSEASTEARR